MTTKKKSLNQKKENNSFDNSLSSTTQLAGTGLLSSINREHGIENQLSSPAFLSKFKPS